MFSQLKNRAVELGIKATGKGVTADFLRKKIAEAEANDANGVQLNAESKISSTSKTTTKNVEKSRPSVKKAIKNVGKTKSFQTQFRERDPDYFNTIKKIVPKMPDVRGFRSEEAKRSVGVWNNEKRYEYLLSDFDLLDRSEQLGRGKDKRFIEMLNELFDEPIGRWIKFNQLEVDLEKEKYDINGFIGAYPALSWVLSLTNARFRYWAMFKANPPYEEWIRDYKDLSEGERVSISAKVTSPELMKLLLDPLEEAPLSDYHPDEFVKIEDGKYPGHDLIDIASASKNPILLRYLANKFSAVYATGMIRFVMGGDVEALKIALKKQKFSNIDLLDVIDEAFESGSVEMMNYIEKIKGSKLDMSKTRMYDINLALLNNNLDIVKWADERGYKLTIDNLAEVITSEGANDKTLGYIISKLPSGQSVFTIVYGVFQQRSPLMVSASVPSNLQYMIDNYGDEASEEQWEGALDFAYWNLDSIKNRYPGAVAEAEESINILLNSHLYPEEVLERY